LDQVLVYTNPVLSAGNHTLRVRVTSNLNSNADGAAFLKKTSTSTQVDDMNYYFGIIK
jgi:hypothetical protein